MAIDIVDLTTVTPRVPRPTAPPEEPYTVVLARAINGTNPERLRRIIIDACQRSPQYAQLLGDQLLVSEALVLQYKEEEVKECNSDGQVDDEDEDENEEDEISENDDSNGDDHSVVPKVVKVPKIQPAPDIASKKRLCPRYATCEHCEEEFDVASNGKYDCVWHDGELEYNDESSTWDDWEPETFGEHDTEDNREAYPEGFLWTCCDRVGDKDGCHISRHQEQNVTSKRMRI